MGKSSADKKPSYADLTKRIGELEALVAQDQRTEAKIIQNSGEFRTLAEMLPEAVYEADGEANLIYLNQNGLHQFGYSELQQVSRLKVFHLISPKNHSTAHKNYSALTKGKEIGCHAYTAIRQDGSTFEALFLCKPMRKDDRIVGVRGFVRDVSACRNAKQALQMTHAELQQKALKLKEANIALKVLLRQHERAKTKLAEDVQANVETLIFPHLARIKEAGLSAQQKMMLSVLEAELRQIVSPFARSLEANLYRLTPMEVRVADLIKHGKTTKEISALLCVANSTIDSHRNHIREKLNIKHRKINLRTYLQTLT